MLRCLNPRCQATYPPGTIQCTNQFCRCLLPEAVVAGRYRVETLIGTGGMGAVYRASDTFEVQQVALKIMSPVYINMDITVAAERFRREARYAHQLQHPNIVPVLNFGQDGEMLYITMPLITGGSLKNLFKQQIPLPTMEAQRFLNDLSAAIDAIHQHPQQIVHRDIKPSNLLIHQDDGRLMVTDFGIARAMQQEKPLTQRGWSLGTEHYIAPEQEHGQPEPASDIYAMGIIAYQMFTGLLPFQAVVKNHAAALPDPSELNLTLPPAVDAIILKAIEVNPNQRFRTGKEFADALNDALISENIWSQPTIAEDVSTLVTTNNANTIVRMLIPDNPCAQCGGENRSSSRFCRHCGHSLTDISPLMHEVNQVGYASDSGQRSLNNEDMILIVQGLANTLPPPPRSFGLFAVADGLRAKSGTNAGGQEASRLAIETVADILVPLLTTTTTNRQFESGGPATNKHAGHALAAVQIPPETLQTQWVRDAVDQANKVIYHCNADYGVSMASTVTAALVHKHLVSIASIGDSRAYHYNPQKGLRLITRDHTLAANLVDAHLLHPDELSQSPKRHQHYRYLGQSYTIKVDTFQVKMEATDKVLLCTDGLWHMLPDQHIQDILAGEENPQQCAQNLIRAANAAGGDGNISAIVIQTP